MGEYILPVVDLAQKELLLFASLCFILGAIDDVIFDVVWMAYSIKRKLFVYTRHHRVTVEDLPPSSDDSPLAIFVPAWQEAAVIGAMLRRCLDQWSHRNYRIYVGCYPNDGETIAAVAAAAKDADHIRIIICDHDGPTSKADCLNRLWRALCHDENIECKSYKSVVLQDAEDLVHPKALDLFDYLIDKAPLVQIPVIPRRAARSVWIAGHYGDEFAEMHGKQMVLREALGVSMPSAGVGTAFRRDELRRLSALTHGKPFDAASLTEDYEIGLQMTQGTARGIFARLKDNQGQWVATQEFFPESFDDAIRQKSRWMMGIAMSGWDRLGWQPCWRENWMRFRDRKASFAAFVLAIAYVGILLTGFLYILQLYGLYQSSPLSDLLLMMLGINALFVAWRLTFKGYFVFKLYGLREALLSVPRTLVANIINIMAARRALFHYLQSLTGVQPKWEKTNHFHPDYQDVRQLRPTRVSICDD
ncbi:glycosyl transferase family protein [Parasphingorhabdus cellanae]|uniref:Glycosyl transferase family protein n=1 Tax=Parasphingorhabdus cellanae TaxID=2806553 RepID=A0ABX7T2K3_9SPHN|nr:glycosyl transferase family protein [Parasphingorhabdus cellanae]QTD55771.1 glycosyl transferase family protein [Parasphingorhabdus cellanae]